jgi:hypothetical protein
LLLSIEIIEKGLMIILTKSLNSNKSAKKEDTKNRAGRGAAIDHSLHLPHQL